MASLGRRLETGVIRELIVATSVGVEGGRTHCT